MTSNRLRIVYLTAGAAGMYCGSCLNDNAVAKELIEQGHDAILVPVYTPIRTDDDDVSIDQVFLGGVSVYLSQKLPWINYLPAWVDRFLNHPKLISLATKNAGKTSPQLLGELSASMLRGMKGRQRKEFQRLIDWFANDIRPDVLVFTNLLIGGCIPELKTQSQVKIVVTLQGDDIFLDSLPANYRREVLQLMRALVQHVDAFIVHSNDYAARMKLLLDIPDSKLVVIPLGIPTLEFTRGIEQSDASITKSRLYVIGYLARMAPEKGLHRLIDAFIRIANEPDCSHATLKLAGWMGPQHTEFWQEQQAKLTKANLAHRCEYVGSIDRQQKSQFLKSIDLFCVPTTYQEPKGLFLLEAVASGVPYLQPSHGAFTELHARILQSAGTAHAGELFDPVSPTISNLETTSVEAGELEENLRIAIRRGDSRYAVPEALLNEIGIAKHAERFLELVELCRSTNSTGG